MATGNPQVPSPLQPAQPVPAPVAQPAPAAQPSGAPAEHHHQQEHEEPQLLIFGHSNFFYWWPVWAIGFLMGFLTWAGGEAIPIPPNGDQTYMFYPSPLMGVIFTLVFCLVILSTNVTMRGIYSVVFVMAAVLLVVLIAYFQFWHVLVDWGQRLHIYLNMGFYMFFSTVVFVIWALNVFIFDRMDYWKLRPGQLTHEHVIGGAAKSYDTRGMVFEKYRQDLFRNWILGLGSGELKITTMGARHEDLTVHNVLFVDSKVRRIQQLIAEHQEHFSTPYQM